MPQPAPLFANLAAMLERFEERHLIQLTDEAGAGAIDEARVAQVLASSDALITAYVAARHRDTATLAGHPILTDVACDYAFSLLWKSDPPEWVMTRRREAIARLEKIAAGTIKLDAGQEEAAPRPGQVLTSGPERAFDRDSLKGF